MDDLILNKWAFDKILEIECVCVIFREKERGRERDVTMQGVDGKYESLTLRNLPTQVLRQIFHWYACLIGENSRE